MPTITGETTVDGTLTINSDTTAQNLTAQHLAIVDMSLSGNLNAQHLSLSGNLNAQHLTIVDMSLSGNLNAQRLAVTDMSLSRDLTAQHYIKLISY